MSHSVFVTGQYIGVSGSQKQTFSYSVTRERRSSEEKKEVNGDDWRAKLGEKFGITRLFIGVVFPG